jgi:hypothetical protein
MSDADLFDAIIQEAKNLDLISKKVRFGKKSDFWYHSWINRLLNLFYPKDRKDVYLNQYWTTIGYSIAAPDSAVDDEGKCEDWETLIHELEHTRQARKWTRPFFAFLYLWPLSQGALFVLLSWLPFLWVPWDIAIICMGIMGLVGSIHFIPQWPDPWRAYWELKAYEISMYFRMRRRGNLSGAYIDSLVDNFSSMTYFMMEPRKSKIRTILDRISVAILMGKHPVVKHPLVKLAQRLRSVH